MHPTTCTWLDGAPLSGDSGWRRRKHQRLDVERMLTGFFDESGHSSATEFFALAAFVAEDADWATFEGLWRQVLAQSGAPYLHMREFAHRVGAFKGWTEDRRRGLLAGCVAAIKSIRAIAVGAATSVIDFRALTPEAQSKLQDPFFCCFQEVVRGAALNAYFEPQGSRVRMVFSQHDQFSSMARKLWDVMAETIDVKDRIGSLAFEDMPVSPRSRPPTCSHTSSGTTITFERLGRGRPRGGRLRR